LLTGPFYLRNILNSDSDPETEASPSSSHSKGKAHAAASAHESADDPGCCTVAWLRDEEDSNYLRQQLCLPPGVLVDLWALADPPGGQRPFASLPTLIKLAIHGSPHKRLTLHGIYGALVARFVWFHEHQLDDSWKDSVRHNLSLNKVFRKVPRGLTQMGKGCYWELDLSGGEGHKRPRKRRKSEMGVATAYVGSDHVGSDHEELELESVHGRHAINPAPATSTEGPAFGLF